MASENQDIVAEFAVESQEHLANIENELLAIEEGGANIDVELVNKVFRSVHSIKGACGFLGFVTIGELAHSMENVLNLLRNRELVPNAAMVDVLLKAADTLRGLILNIEQSNGSDIQAHLHALHNIIENQTAPEVQTSAVNSIEFAGPDGILLHATELVLDAQRKRGHSLYIIDFDLVADADAKGRTPLELIRELLVYGELLDSWVPWEQWGGLESEPPSSLRFLALMGSMIDEVGMIATALDVDPSRVLPTAPLGQTIAAPALEEPYPTAEFVPAVEFVPAPAPAPAPVTAPPAAPTALAPVAPPSPSKSGADGPAETSIRVSVGLLDHLMNLAGELVLGRNQLMQMIMARSQSGLDSVGARLNQVTSELQEAIMQTRMQPIGSVFSKFPRVVRDLSTKLGKQCELIVEGKEVELDRSLLEIITDPLTHLVRNSIDHGVEKPEVRASSGKRAMGQIVLKAFHQAGKVNISISDDGRGIDPAVIRKLGIERGLIDPVRDREMSDRDVIRLIFHPGFSTAEKVSDVSGRGVGMDVVRTNIEKAGGTVEVDSHPGQGTCVHVRLPLTLAIIPSLIVRCCGERYAIPQVSISELVRIKASDIAQRIEELSGAEVLRLRGSLLPLVSLEKALNVPSGGSGGKPLQEETAVNIIVVESGHLRYGLKVDGLQDSEEIVVKPLGSHLKGTPCLAGATILGDGRVALILDVAGIASHCHLTMPQESDSEHSARSAARQGQEMQTVLLFTNDPKEQFGIPMGLISRIERIRTTQIDSVGGQEVLQYRGASLPLLTLERYVKARPRSEQETVHIVVFRIGRQEVGLVAPTLIDIRDILAELDAVTFREPGISGSTVVEGRATRLVDLVELVRLARPEWVAEETTRNAGHVRKRILLAEDSGFFRKQVQDMLETDGYDVLGCEDGAAAWAALQEADPPVDVVITDIEMPNLDGYGLTRHIRSDPRFADLPVIAVTSLAGQEDLERGREAGVDEYQIKLDRDQLLETVTRFLRVGRAAPVAGGRHV